MLLSKGRVEGFTEHFISSQNYSALFPCEMAQRRFFPITLELKFSITV